MEKVYQFIALVSYYEIATEWYILQYIDILSNKDRCIPIWSIENGLNLKNEAIREHKLRKKHANQYCVVEDKNLLA